LNFTIPLFLKNKKGDPSVFSGFLLIFLLFFTSCVKENAVPAYISIPSFSFTTTTGQGTSAQKISDVWVYVDGQSLGAYQIPARFPYLGVGKHEFLLFAGIRNNGIRDNPVIFSPAKTFATTLDIKSGDDVTIRPTTTYIDGVKIWFNEDFERTNIFSINRDNNTATGFSVIPSGFEGKGASITLTKTNPIIEKASSVKAQLPDNAQTTLIELHYKTESRLAIGIIGYSSANLTGEVIYKIFLNPNTTWNKTYIDVTEEAKNLKSKDFQVVFRSELPDSLNQATILIDNVKLIQK
jgi:hypothetical protein